MGTSPRSACTRVGHGVTDHGSPIHPPVDLDGYEIIDEIGEGGFSVVYRARQIALNREVAVKVLTSGFSSEVERRTFERECHALGRLSHHPNIVTVFNDALTRDGRPAIVMELYGANYRDRLSAQGPLPPDEVLDLGIRLAGALQTAHDHDVLHRDLKPHNIFVSAYGEPALGDFGISTIDDERSQSRGSGLSIAYAAPEGLEGDEPSAAGDIYSLAVTMYQLISGSTPFSSGELATTVRRILTESPARLDRANLPAGLNRVLSGALSKLPGDRPRSMHDFAEQLREIQRRNGFPVTPIPRLHDDSSRAIGTLARPPLAGPTRDGSVTGNDRSGTDSSRSGVDAPMSSIPRVLRRSGTPAPPPGRKPVRATSNDVAHPNPETTMARARPDAAPEPFVDHDTDPGRGTRVRRRLAIAGVVVTIVAIIAGVTVARSGGEETASTTTRVGTVPPDTFFELLEAPDTVRVNATDGGFNVTYRMPDSATAVEIEIVSGSDDGVTTTGEGDPIEIATDATTLCVVARSIGTRGRLSTDTAPICSG